MKAGKLVITIRSQNQSQHEIPARDRHEDKICKSVLRNRVMKVEKLETAIRFQYQNQHEIPARVGHREEIC
jgi:hypothetical protein